MNKIFSENYVAAISVLWIVLMACLVILKRQTLTSLDLNSIGDFLAGAFAPLGFFWLVAGFKQQGVGLEQNSIALKMQAEELKASTKALENQVREQQNLLKATNEEIQIIKEKNDYEKMIQHKNAQPFFHILKVYGQIYRVGRDPENHNLTTMSLDIEFTNTREVCRELDIVLCTPIGIEYYVYRHPVIFNTEDKVYYAKVSFMLSGLIQNGELTGLKLKFSYLDSIDQLQNVFFSISPKNAYSEKVNMIEFRSQRS